MDMSRAQGEVQPEKQSEISCAATAGAGKFDPAELLARASVVKDSRSTRAGTVDGLFIKRYNRRGFFHTLKRLFQTPRPYRCKKTAEHLAAAGIPTPEVLFTNREFLVTEALDVRFGNQQIPPVGLLAATLRRIHSAGVYHGDASMRNFYFTGTGGILGVIDLDGAKIYRKIPPKAVSKDIARAISSYMIVSDMRSRQDLVPELTADFLAAYCGNSNDGVLLDYIHKRINYLLQRIRK